MPKLVITDNEGSRTIALDREVKAGRLADNEIQLKVPEASRHHCRFFGEGGTWFVEDMGSSNGTLVNGRKVSKFELQDGDLIAVGAVTIRFLDSAATPQETGAPAAGGWGDDEISLETEVFLVLGAAGREGEVVKIKGDKLTIGRRAKNDVVLTDASVSQDHAEIKKSAAGWTVRDLRSSNGTFLGGAKVDEAALTSGDVLSFGEVPATFGIGDPKEFSAPTPAAVERADTAVMQGASAFSDPTFELHDVAEKKSPLGSILAIVLLVGLAGGFAWLYINRDKLAGEGGGTSGGGAVHVAANLVPQKFWSFEPHEVDPSDEDHPGWHKEDAIDTSSTGETQDPVHSGDQAWSIARREADKGATSVFLSGSQDCDIAVSAGATYRLSAWMWADSAKIVPGVAVSWIEPIQGGEVREVAREIVPAAPPAKQWTEVAGLVEAPQGATRARVGVIAAGTGEVVFDDVVLAATPEPAGRGASAQNFRAWLTPGGALRVFHFARSVSDGIGFWKTTQGASSPPWQSFVPKAGGPAQGTLRDAGTDVAITLSAAENAFNASWSLTGTAADHAFLIPLPGGAQAINVTLLGGDRARRMRAAFQKQEALGVIFGDQGDRVRLKFLDAEMKPQAASLDVVVAGDRAFLMVDLGGRATIALKCELSFDAEMAQAQQLMAMAHDAASKRRFGEAMTSYEEVAARFPFDEATEKQALAALERLASDGRASIRTLGARVDDAKFFRTAKTDDVLLADLEAEVARYANTNLQAEVKLKLDEFVQERTRSAAEKNAAEAKAAYDRAVDYAGMESSRREVAMALLELIVARYPGTEWAEPAQKLLDKLRAK